MEVMDYLAAAVLGLIQGLTEFLPISSSAHLILVPWIFGWEPQSMTFDVSLHLGTAVAVLAYFWREWIELGRETVRGLLQGKPFGNAQRRFAWFLFVGTIPAVVVGLRFERFVEQNLRSPLVPATTLVVFAVYLFVAERRGSQSRGFDQFGLIDSVWIGIGQALALIPGISRSGVTIGTGLFRGLDRASSTRFSFLLSMPVIVGAALLEGIHLLQAIRDPAALVGHPGISGPVSVKLDVLAVGVLSAGLTGFLCIRYFLRYVQTRSFTPFVLYRIFLACVVLVFYMRHGG
jgi:undecaprenyl-diphosphatase